MFGSNHPAAKSLKQLGALDIQPTKAMLDSAAQAEAEKKQALLDATDDSIAKYASDDIRSSAMATLIEWAKTPEGDLEDGENYADRLLAMNIGIADEGQDGDLTDEESDVVDVALNAQADYLASQGVSDADISALLEDADSEAAGRVLELLQGSLPEDSDAALAAADSFVFDAESSESVLDGVMSLFDAVYKKKIAFRHGKKVRINKRVSGKVRLSAQQKVAIRKAGLKARSSGARVRRMRSMKLRRNAGL